MARQWILCGGESFEGGVKQGPDGAFIRPGDAPKFLEHVEENCLTLCGLPFSKLDKKSEKKFLNARRQRLMSLLDDTTDAETALDFRIALLYQLVKNMVVSSGPNTRTPILSMLSKERKASGSEVEQLIAIARKISSKEPITVEELPRKQRRGTIPVNLPNHPVQPKPPCQIKPPSLLWKNIRRHLPRRTCCPWPSKCPRRNESFALFTPVWA